MTTSEDTTRQGAKRSSQFARTANTLRLAHLMEEQQRLEIAERITQLREKSRWTQPEIADKLGLSLRGYQKIEEKGTTKYERVEEIAQIHDADPDWIWEARERGATPDPFELDQLSRIEHKLDQVMRHLEVDDPAPGRFRRPPTNSHRKDPS